MEYVRQSARCSFNLHLKSTSRRLHARPKPYRNWESLQSYLSSAFVLFLESCFSCRSGLVSLSFPCPSKCLDQIPYVLQLLHAYKFCAMQTFAMSTIIDPDDDKVVGKLDSRPLLRQSLTSSRRCGKPHFVSWLLIAKTVITVRSMSPEIGIKPRKHAVLLRSIFIFISLSPPPKSPCSSKLLLKSTCFLILQS